MIVPLADVMKRSARKTENLIKLFETIKCFLNAINTVIFFGREGFHHLFRWINQIYATRIVVRRRKQKKKENSHCKNEKFKLYDLPA